MSTGANFREEIDPLDRGLIARAKTLPNCFLWMSHANGPAPADPAQFEEVAGCFEATAEAIVLIKAILDENSDTHQAELEEALDLLAEAQSALRAAVARIDGPTDTDQFEVFNWIKAYAYENQVYIRRYMRVDDPADPGRWPTTVQRIRSVGVKLDETHRRAKHRKKLFGKVRHKATQIAKEPATAAEHWPSLAQVVDELVNDGLPPSNRELRDLLLPVIDLVPDDLEEPRGLQLVTREIDRYLATCPPVETVAAAQEPTAEVRRAARLLGGRSLVLIGGVRRPGADEALKRSLGLRELYWIETREHQSIDSFEPVIARPDVAAVVLAIRWSSHSFGDVKEFCDRYDKPLVRLPAGYNPNQVAVQIEAQCSERLKAGDGARA